MKILMCIATISLVSSLEPCYPESVRFTSYKDATCQTLDAKRNANNEDKVS